MFKHRLDTYVCTILSANDSYKHFDGIRVIECDACVFPVEVWLVTVVVRKMIRLYLNAWFSAN